jgi:hypothetical protein
MTFNVPIQSALPAFPRLILLFLTRANSRLRHPSSTLILLAASVLAAYPSSALPNLQVTSVTVEDAAVRPGDGNRVEWTVTNMGNSPASGSREDRLNLVRETGGSPIPVATYGYVTAISPGESLVLRWTIGVPADASLGSYTIMVETDWRNELAESNGTDNTLKSETFAVTLPSLIVSDMSAVETFSPLGPAYRVEWKVQNISSEISALGTWYDSVVLTSSHPFFEERELLRYGYYTLLQPGEHIDYSRTVYVPGDVWEGEYCLGVRTDIREEQRELLENDNDKQMCGLLLAGEPAPPVPVRPWGLLILASMFCLVGASKVRRYL